MATDERRIEVAAAGMLHDLGIDYDGPGDPMVGHAATLCRALLLVASKSKDYGNSWRRHGYMGSLLKADIKMSRLMNMLWYGHAPEVQHEPIEDSWRDLLIYALFGLQQWTWGDANGRRD